MGRDMRKGRHGSMKRRFFLSAGCSVAEGGSTLHSHGERAGGLFTTLDAAGRRRRDAAVVYFSRRDAAF